MRFFADESCDHSVVRAYRMAGHDVTRLSRGDYGSPDHDVLSTSVEQNRILLTEDKDFGDLIYLFGLQAEESSCSGSLKEPGTCWLIWHLSFSTHVLTSSRTVSQSWSLTESGSEICPESYRPSTIASAIFSPIIIVVTLILARTQSGMIEASTTRMPSSP